MKDGRMNTAQVGTSSVRRSVSALVVATSVILLPTAATISPSMTSTLSGTAWQLVSIDARHAGVTAPDDGTKYTLSFGADKRALIRADCNRGVASWHSTEETNLEFGAPRMTKMNCAEGSMHERFVNDLGYVRSYSYEDGHLILGLADGGGTLEFAPLK
jgi:heat shock protein HslJ